VLFISVVVCGVVFITVKLYTQNNKMALRVWMVSSQYLSCWIHA